MDERQRQRATPPDSIRAIARGARGRTPRGVIVAIFYHPLTARAGALVAVAVLTAIGTQVKTWNNQHELVVQNQEIEKQAQQAKLKAIAAETRVDNTIKVSTNPLVDEMVLARAEIRDLKADVAKLRELTLSFVVTGSPSPKKRQLVKAVAASAVKASQDLKAHARKPAPLAQKVPETVPDKVAQVPPVTMSAPVNPPPVAAAADAR